MPKVFLGGTCNGDTWRDWMIPQLKIDYFNPVVEDWTPECQQEEIKQRQTCDLVLYFLTQRMKGVYSIAEVVDDSNKRPEKTIFALDLAGLQDYWEEDQVKSIMQVAKMVEANGGKVITHPEHVVEYLNQFAEKPQQEGDIL
jgi:Nucleoside 2-deoxyribosyltransferase like